MEANDFYLIQVESYRIMRSFLRKMEQEKMQMEQRNLERELNQLMEATMRMEQELYQVVRVANRN